MKRFGEGGPGITMLDQGTIDSAERQLTDIIYAALLGESDWQHFLDALNRFVPGGISTLFFHDQAEGQGGLSLAAGLDVETSHVYAAHYCRLNPWMAQVERTPLGVGIVGDHILPRGEFVRTEYYADFLKRREIEAGVGVTLFRDARCSFLLSSLTSRIDPDQNQSIAQLLTRLSPHLERAFRYYRADRAGGLPAVPGMSLGGSGDIGVVIIGDRLQVRTVSRRGRELLEAGLPAALTAQGTVRLAGRDADEVMRLMLRRDYQGPRSHVVYTAHHRVTILQAEADPAIRFFAGPSVALIIEEPRPFERHFDLAWLSHRFRLTPAEARVADGVAAGLSLEEIARRAGIGRETVRSQLKAIYGKTGVNSQTALVRLALLHAV